MKRKIKNTYEWKQNIAVYCGSKWYACQSSDFSLKGHTKIKKFGTVVSKNINWKQININ